MEGERDNEGNYRAFMTIASVDSRNDLSNLVDELGDFPKMRKLKNRKMKTCIKMMAKTTFKSI